MNLPKKLLHNITIYPLASLDAYGAKVYKTPITSVPCFIMGSQKRIVDSRGEVYQTGFSILFLPTATIGLDFLLANGVNYAGTVTLINTARMVSFEAVDHPRKGLQFYEVWATSEE